MQIHVVSSGETLFSIAQRYDVPAGILARYNGLAEPYRLAVGQSLLILRPTGLVTVRAGDTLSSLARQNGQSVRSPVSYTHLMAALAGLDVQTVRLRPAALP